MAISRAKHRRWTVMASATLLAGMACGGAIAAPVHAAEGQIRDAGTDTVVKNSYIVVLKDTATVRRSGVRSMGSDLTERYGGTVHRTYQHALRGFEISLSESAARKLAADDSVDFIQRNGIHTIEATQTNPPWGLDRIDQRNLPLNSSYTYGTTASNVHAYVIDTGIRFTHNDFGGRAVSGRDTVNNDNDASDCNGHGTHVAGTVGGSTYGVAKGVQLVGVRVLNCQGSGTTAQVTAGIDWVTANAVKPAVANMSLGGGADSAIDRAVSNSIGAGITYALAAGNENTNACNGSPARVAAAITVGATERTDRRSSFSNYGTCVDVFAPGSSILSAWYTNNTATNTISGTSMASPHVAGAAALVLADNPTFTPAQVASAIVSAATPDVVTNPGSGSPNRLLHTGGTTTPPPPPGCSGTNDADVAIPDAGSAVTSTITISGCARNASATSTVRVDIPHTYRGDLVIDLLAPDGTSYRLKNSSSGDSADNVNTTFTADLSGEAANGAWRLQVRDVYRSDTGHINSWTLTV